MNDVNGQIQISFVMKTMSGNVKYYLCYVWRRLYDYYVISLSLSSTLILGFMLISLIAVTVVVSAAGELQLSGCPPTSNQHWFNVSCLLGNYRRWTHPRCSDIREIQEIQILHAVLLNANGGCSTVNQNRVAHGWCIAGQWLQCFRHVDANAHGWRIAGPPL